MTGFRGTAAQAAVLLDTMIDPAGLTVLLAASDEDIIRRLASRRICDACAITQSIQEDREDRDGCPYCGGNLVRRPDDHPDIVRRRLSTYAAFATPVIGVLPGTVRPSARSISGLQSAVKVTGGAPRAHRREPRIRVG